MRLRFGHSWNLGPFRINLSSRGFGFSVGTRRFRLGVAARGGPYVQIGTGPVSYRRFLTGRREHRDDD